MRARVLVRLKPDVLDPQGDATRRGLSTLGISGVRDVRVGRLIELEVDGARADVSRAVQEAVEKLLVNPVTEECSVEIIDAEGPVQKVLAAPQG